MSPRFFKPLPAGLCFQAPAQPLHDHVLYGKIGLKRHCQGSLRPTLTPLRYRFYLKLLFFMTKGENDVRHMALGETG